MGGLIIKEELRGEKGRRGEISETERTRESIGEIKIQEGKKGNPSRGKEVQ